MKLTVGIGFLAVMLVAVNSLVAQQAEHPGVSLYKQGKFFEAINSLSVAVKSKEYKNEPELWNTLGLAYFAQDDYKKATKALTQATKISPIDAVFRTNLAYAYLKLGDFRKAESEASSAIGIDPSNPMSYYVRGTTFLAKSDIDKAQQDADKIIALDDKFGAGYLLASDIQLVDFSREIAKSPSGIEAARGNVEILGRAKKILDNGFEKTASSSDRERIKRELESVTAFFAHFSKEPRKPGEPIATDPSVVPIKIISKPKATYTDPARNNLVRGTIRMAVLLGASGRVEGVILLTRLGYGLDENAIAAARSIKFEPKMKDGKPVSSVVTIEYGFDIY